ncbi:hypothetical protein ACTU45_04615 [Streptomyces sp. 24-1644]|uniref:hypothetical protein n=1 Tax=Streptomyces sp. 24-1644 TaxID=3457315 RepID=UPI003FA69E3A
MNHLRLRAIPRGLVITACLLALSACSSNDEPPVKRSDGVGKDFGRVTTPDLKKWIKKSDLPLTTKSLIDLYVSKIHVTEGFAGCLTEERTEPLMNVELAYPDLGQYDDEGLREQRDWSRQIISGLEEFAHTFEPGYFTDGSLIGGPTWVTDPEGGLDCSGSIEMGQLLTPPANLQTDYHQRDNTPIP